MKSIMVSENLHKWIMDHKNSERTSAEKVIYGLIGSLDTIKNMTPGERDGDDVCASIISCGVCEEMKEIAAKELGK